MGFVSEANSGFVTSTITQVVGVTVAAGDVLVVYGMTGGTATTLPAPTGGGLTYTLRASSTGVAGNANVYMWTSSPSASGLTFDVSITASSSSLFWGFSVQRWNAINSIGNGVSGSGNNTEPSINLTTTTASEIIVFGNSDTNGTTGTTTYRNGAGTFTQTVDVNNAGDTTRTWTGFHPDAGTAAVKTVGQTAPTFQRWASVAVALLPQLGPTPTATSLGVTPASPVAALTTETLTATVTPSAAGTVQFTDNAGNIGAPVATVAGIAEKTTVLTSGAHSLGAAFTPTDPLAFGSSNATPVAYTVEFPPAPAISRAGSMIRVGRRFLNFPGR